jgi:hypothetical protein
MIAFTRLQRHHLTQSLEKRTPHPHIRMRCEIRLKYPHLSASFILADGGTSLRWLHADCVGCTLIALATQ